MIPLGARLRSLECLIRFIVSFLSAIDAPLTTRAILAKHAIAATRAVSTCCASQASTVRLSSRDAPFRCASAKF